VKDNRDLLRPAGRVKAELDQGKGTTMTRQRILLAMLVIGVVLSLTAGLRADTKVIISHAGPRAGVGFGAWIGGPIVAPGCHPPVHRHVVVGSPWRHRFVRIGPPVVVRPPFVRVAHPPVVRHVVVEPPPVVIRTPAPVEESVVTVWITNSNGSRTSVRLTRDGPWYVGPRGEYYTEIPTNEQLRVVYGF
jgi:hypothetical protein